MDKFYLLIKLKKQSEAKDKIKKLLHIQSSFVRIYRISL